MASRQLIDGLLDKLHWARRAEHEALKKQVPNLSELAPVEVVRRASEQTVKRPIDELAEIAGRVAKEKAGRWWRRGHADFANKLHELARTTAVPGDLSGGAPGNVASEQGEPAEPAPKRLSTLLPAGTTVEQVLTLLKEAFPRDFGPEEETAVMNAFKSERRAKDLGSRLI